MRNINFTTKEEYLQYRKDWKEEYKNLTGQIRFQRKLQKSYNKMMSKATLECGPKIRGNWNNEIARNKRLKELISLNKEWNELYNKYGTSPYYENLFFKNDSLLAREMLEELKVAKQKSHEQYLQQKELTV